MKTIWKFTLTSKKQQQIEMPANAEIVNGVVQQGKPVVWAIVQTENPMETKNFELVGTGENIVGSEVKFVCSFHFSEGKYVQHLFEVIEKESFSSLEKATDIIMKEDSTKNKNVWLNFNVLKSKKSLQLSNNQLTNKIRGALFGHAIGDAIGLATEFMTKEQVNYYYRNGVNSYKQIIKDKHRNSWTPGEWTDDTEQMLCILDSLLDNCKVDQLDIAHRIHAWAFNGGRGIGNTTYKVLTSGDFLTTPEVVSKRVWELSGRHLAANGAVMRTSVVGLWNFKNDDAVVRNAEKIAQITHFDPRCVGSSAIISLAIAKLLQGNRDYDMILDFLKPLSMKYDKRIEPYINLSQNSSISDLNLCERNSIGYTLKTMSAGLWALKHNDFKKCIQSIIHEGGDADTNAAVAGAVLGAKLGYEKLPKEWVNGLIEKDKLEKKIELFITLLESKGYLF